MSPVHAGSLHLQGGSGLRVLDGKVGRGGGGAFLAFESLCMSEKSGERASKGRAGLGVSGVTQGFRLALELQGMGRWVEEVGLITT